MTSTAAGKSRAAIRARLQKAQQALEDATHYLSAMSRPQRFPEFKRGWDGVLSALEKVWSRIEKSTRRTEFDAEYQKASALRETDPLLAYLKAARDTDQHSVEEIVSFEPGRYEATIPGAPEGETYIKSLMTDADGRVAHYEGNRPLIVTETPARVRLLSVESVRSRSKRRRLQPPVESPQEIAEAGLRYYADLLIRALQTFSEENDPKP